MRILFIGNSHTYFNDLPYIFKKICEENDIETEVTMLARAYKGLDYHCEEHQTRFNILFGNYDYIILQHSQSGFDRDILFESVAKLKKYIDETKAVPVLYMTWTLKSEKEKQEYMTSGYIDAGKKFNIKVAPAGEVWWKFLDKFPDKNLYFTDDKHPSELGSALAAYTIFNAVFGKTAHTENADYQEMNNIINTTK